MRMSDEHNIRELDFILFMHLERNGWEYTRRVSAFYEATDASSQQGESHRPLFIWDNNSDKFYQQGNSLLLQTLASNKGIAKKQIYRQLAECEDFIRWLIAQRINDYRRVRQEVVQFYNASAISNL